MRIALCTSRRCRHQEPIPEGQAAPIRCPACGQPMLGECPECRRPISDNSPARCPKCFHRYLPDR